MTRVHRLTALLAAAGLLSAPAVRAAGDYRSTAGGDKGILLVIAGGVSRGAYQAGQTWALVRYLQRLRAAGLYEGQYGTGEPTVVGSSAGSINALLASLELARAPVPPAEDLPERSPLFTAWVSLGFDRTDSSLDVFPLALRGGDEAEAARSAGPLRERCELVAEGLLPRCDGQHPQPPGCEDLEAERARLLNACLKVDEPSLINRAPLHALLEGFLSEVQTEDAGGFPAVRLGITTARHIPGSDPRGVVQEVNESFGFRVVPRAGGGFTATSLRLECRDALGEEAEGCHTDALTLCRGDMPPPHHADALDPGLETAATLVLPSSGIPGAFPVWPMACEDYLGMSLWPKTYCHAFEEGEGWGADRQTPIGMIDGGTLDGNPIRVGRALSYPLGKLHEGADPSDLTYIFLDPDLLGDPMPVVPVSTQPWEDVMATLGLAGKGPSLLSAMRHQSLTQFFQDHREIYNDQSLLETQTPPYGSYLGDFLAFYDRSFRVWDFYAGLYDALGYVEGLAQDLCEEQAQAQRLQDPTLDVARAVASCLEAVVPVPPPTSGYGPVGGALEEIQDIREARTAAELAAIAARGEPAPARARRGVSPLAMLRDDWERKGEPDVARIARDRVDDRFGDLSSPRDGIARAACVTPPGAPTCRPYGEGPTQDSGDVDLLVQDLRYLTLLHAARSLDLDHAEDGQAYDLDWLAANLSGRRGENAEPFRAADLAQGPHQTFTDALRARVDWQLRQMVRRDVLPPEPGLALAGSVARGAMTADRWRVVTGLGTPPNQVAVTALSWGPEVQGTRRPNAYLGLSLTAAVPARIPGEAGTQTEAGGDSEADRPDRDTALAFAQTLRLGLTVIALGLPEIPEGSGGLPDVSPVLGPRLGSLAVDLGLVATASQQLVCREDGCAAGFELSRIPGVQEWGPTLLSPGVEVRLRAVDIATVGLQLYVGDWDRSDTVFDPGLGLGLSVAGAFPFPVRAYRPPGAAWRR